MSVRHLDSLFRPASVAVIGASNRPGSVGAVIMRNLVAGGFAGPIMPVNPRADAVAGVLAYESVAALPQAPDLAVICTPPPAVPGLVADLAARGTRAAVVITAGLGRIRTETGETLRDAMLAAARPHNFRILGPNCVGLLVPTVGLNASFAHTDALKGSIAFLSQSGGMCTAVLDWARSRGIGFSAFASLGDAADVDFGDLLDYLASDPGTRSILLYVEAITQPRKFMSAARAAARNKPVVVIKAGRENEGARAAASHTGALAGADDVYAAAIRRAGMLRVDDIDSLFASVETLARLPTPGGERLAILTNGGGPGVMVTDSLIAGGGRLAELAPATVAALDACLPANWSRGNPVDIVGDAPPRRYLDAFAILARDPGVDAVLVLHVPVAVADASEIARGLIEPIRAAGKPVLTSWMGADAVAEARRIFEAAGIATFDSPDEAVTAFLQMAAYRRNQEWLAQTPPSIPEEVAVDRAAVRAIVEAVLDEGREILTEPEAKDLLAAYGVPVVETRIAADPTAAADLAAEIGFPVAVKVLSPEVSHKSDVGGVALDLEDGAAVAAAAEAMADRLARLRPDARLAGFTVQPMARRTGAQELIVGLSTDPLFGPVVLFGQGGTAVEVVADKAVALPPLNMVLARGMIDRTRVARLLAGYRDRPPADMTAICLTLVRVAQLATDHAEIAELDINPLFADSHGVLALDARVRLDATQRGRAGADRLVISPYPRELEERAVLGDGGQVLLRPIRPEDEPGHRAFFESLPPEDVRFRFFSFRRQMDHSQMARFTQIDYDREMAFIALPDAAPAGGARTLGVARLIADPDGVRGEFAVIVGRAAQGRGLGRLLLEKTVRYARERGLSEIVGRILADNVKMRGLAAGLGFVEREADKGEIEVVLPLRP